MATRWILGLSSGTSRNGVDAALVRVDGIGLDLKLSCGPGRFLRLAYPRELRELLRLPAPTLRQLGMMHRVLGETFSSAVFKLLDQTQFARDQVLAIALSGQTVWHDPDSRFPNTLSFGMPAALAEGTGISVLSDFRSRDVVLGGQGAPLTPILDAMLFQHPDEHRVLLHLGGVATAVSLHPERDLWDTVAFQVGPCALLLDRFIHRVTGGKEAFDAGGKHAVQGRCIEPLLARWLNHPFFQKRLPRTVAPDDFGAEFVDEALAELKREQWALHDLLCTATHFVARSILCELGKHFPKPDRILLSGGCVRNGLLWRLLEQEMTPTPVERLDQFGIPAEARKAVAFAGLAALTLDNVPVNLPSATGAAGSRLLGSFTPGVKENWARCLAWMSAQSPAARWRSAA